MTLSRNLFVVTLLLLCGSAGAQLTDVQRQQSVVCVEQTGLFGRVCGHGTGFFVSRDRVLTAAHVGKGRDFVFFKKAATRIILADGRKVPCYVESCGRIMETDYAILHVPGANGNPLKLAKGSAKGDWVHCYGAFIYDGDVSRVSSGQVIGCTPYGERVSSGSVYPGYSGGPVVNDNGRVVGIVSRYMVEHRGEAIYVPIEAVRKATGL